GAPRRRRRAAVLRQGSGAARATTPGPRPGAGRRRVGRRPGARGDRGRRGRAGGRSRGPRRPGGRRPSPRHRRGRARRRPSRPFGDRRAVRRAAPGAPRPAARAPRPGPVRGRVGRRRAGPVGAACARSRRAAARAGPDAARPAAARAPAGPVRDHRPGTDGRRAGDRAHARDDDGSTGMSAPPTTTGPSIPGVPRRELHLAAFFPFGPHYDWTSVTDPTTYYDADTYAALARAAERGLFSAMFLGDSQRLREHLGRINDTVVTGRPDQLVLFAHLAARTQHLGLVATLNTTFSAPADLAARVATVDRLSGGRAGWNVVTTNDAWTGANFRRGGYLPRSERYRAAEEHPALVRALWDTDRGAQVRRPGARHGLVATASLPPSAQGAPVIFQAGESDEGRDFAARHAEGIFSRYLEPAAAAAFAADLRGRLVAHGRPADDVRIFPAASITLGETEAEAQEKAEWFHRRTWTDRMVVAKIEAVW